MAKKWYPVINYEECLECGVCIYKCSHGVYDEKKAPRPVVVFPDGCVQGCRGCAALCPEDAIQYFGDVTGKESITCCNCSDTDDTEQAISGCGCS